MRCGGGFQNFLTELTELTEFQIFLTGGQDLQDGVGAQLLFVFLLRALRVLRGKLLFGGVGCGVEGWLCDEFVTCKIIFCRRI